MLERSSGRTHEVVSGLCLRTHAWEELHAETTRVTFRPLTRASSARYVASGEWEGRAGGVCDPGSRREPRRAHRRRLPERRRPARLRCSCGCSPQRFPGRTGSGQSLGPSGGPRLTWPCAAKIRASSSGDGRGASGGGSVAASPASRRRGRAARGPAGVLSTSTRAVSLSTRNVCATPIGTTAAPPGPSSNRSSAACDRQLPFEHDVALVLRMRVQRGRGAARERGTRSARNGRRLASPGSLIVASVPRNQRCSPSPLFAPRRRQPSRPIMQRGERSRRRRAAIRRSGVATLAPRAPSRRARS